MCANAAVQHQAKYMQRSRSFANMHAYTHAPTL